MRSIAALILCNSCEILFLGGTLPDQSIHVLVCTAFPRCIGVGKVEVQPEAGLESTSLGTLLKIHIYSVIRGFSGQTS
jgi:hypothetical protein